MRLKEDTLLAALDVIEASDEEQNITTLPQPNGEKISKPLKASVSVTPTNNNETASNLTRFKQVGGHFHKDVHKAIAMIGVTEDRTIQSLTAEAFEELLRKRGCKKSILELTKLTRPTKNKATQ